MSVLSAMEQNPDNSVVTQSRSNIPRASRLPVARNLFAPPSKIFYEASKKGSPSHDLFAPKSRCGHGYGQQERPFGQSGKATKLSMEQKHHNGIDRLANETEQSSITISNPAEREPEQTQMQNQRRPRPSLSDRAIESLSRIPPSPSPRRRKSGFFPDESPARAPSRQGPGREPSRLKPTLGSPPPLPASPTHIPTVAKPSSPSKGRVEDAGRSPQRRVVSSTSVIPSNKIRGPRTSVSSKTLMARPIRERPRIDGDFPPKSSVVGAKEGIPDFRNSSPTKAMQSKPNGQTLEPLRPPKKTVHPSASKLTQAEQAGCSPGKTDKSSATLRETIAKAKAARTRQLQGDMLGTSRVTTDTGPTILDKRLEMARTDGRLNISALALGELPLKIISTYDRNVLDFADNSTFETMALTKLAAADNDIKHLPDKHFPEAHMQSQGVFRTLESLDLHGNRLTFLPPGFSNLQSLSILNLSRNNLTNSCLEVINTIPSLRELRLADNMIEGVLDSDAFSMESLDTLDLNNNAITELPSTFASAPNIRKLFLAGNKISALSFDSRTKLKLVELDVSRNKLSSTLLGCGVSMQGMRVLDASNNALTKLCDNETLDMPELQVLRIEENRLRLIPNLSSCIKLVNLSAAANNISDLPDGMTSLPVLANVDVSRNGLRTIDDRIGLMESLTTFHIANNPIPQRRLMSMATDVLKKEMRERLEGA